MPTWLQIAVPVVVAVAAVLMWALDYTKKSHEIEKLRLELKKLRSDLRRRDGGLYIPTPQEVDDITREAKQRDADNLADGGGPDVSDLVFLALAVFVVLYTVIHFLFDLIHLFRWIFLQ